MFIYRRACKITWHQIPPLSGTAPRRSDSVGDSKRDHALRPRESGCSPFRVVKVCVPHKQSSCIMHVPGENLSIFRRLVGKRMVLLSDSSDARVTRWEFRRQDSRPRCRTILDVYAVWNQATYSVLMHLISPVNCTYLGASDRQSPEIASTAVLLGPCLDEGWLVPRTATITPPMRDTATFRVMRPINVCSHAFTILLSCRPHSARVRVYP
jgi:hypothetical protein